MRTGMLRRVHGGGTGRRHPPLSRDDSSEHPRTNTKPAVVAESEVQHQPPRPKDSPRPPGLKAFAWALICGVSTSPCELPGWLPPLCAPSGSHRGTEHALASFLPHGSAVCPPDSKQDLPGWPQVLSPIVQTVPWPEPSPGATSQLTGRCWQVPLGQQDGHGLSPYRGLRELGLCSCQEPARRVRPYGPPGSV